MAAYAIVYTKIALKDIPKLKAAHLDDKAKELIAVIRENPYQAPPPYEKLAGDLKGLYSRRINQQHRPIHEVFERGQIIRIVSFLRPPHAMTAIEYVKIIPFSH